MRVRPVRKGGPSIEVEQMSYIDLINRFWDIDLEAQFSPIETKLYFAILHIANRLGWKTTLAVPNGRLLAMLGCTKATLIRARQRIIDKGLIEYKKGSTRDAGKYLIKTDWFNYYTSDDTNHDTNHDTNRDTIYKTRLDKTNKIYIPAPAIEKITLLWNQFEISRIPVNREKTDKAVLDAVARHGDKAVMEAIKTYASIVNGKDYILDTRWPLAVFLDLHLEKFLDVESAKAMYRVKGGPNGRSEQRDSRDDWKERFKNPAGTHTDERDLEELLIKSETSG